MQQLRHPVGRGLQVAQDRVDVAGVVQAAGRTGRRMVQHSQAFGHGFGDFAGVIPRVGPSMFRVIFIASAPCLGWWLAGRVRRRGAGRGGRQAQAAGGGNGLGQRADAGELWCWVGVARGERWPRSRPGSGVPGAGGPPPVLPAASGWQRGQRPASAPSACCRRRVCLLHWPHHAGRAWAGAAGAGSSAGDSRVASTAAGLRTPAVFALTNAARAAGSHPAPSAAATIGASRRRCAPVSGQPGPSRVKNSLPLPAGGWPSALIRPTSHTPASAAADGSLGGSKDGSGAAAAPRSCAGCTPLLR